MRGGAVWRAYDACPACRRRRVRIHRGRFFGRVVYCDACPWRAQAPKQEARHG